MKKFLVCIFAAVLALASCSKEEISHRFPIKTYIYPHVIYEGDSYTGDYTTHADIMVKQYNANAEMIDSLILNTFPHYPYLEYKKPAAFPKFRTKPGCVKVTLAINVVKSKRHDLGDARNFEWVRYPIDPRKERGFTFTESTPLTKYEPAVR